MDNEHKYTRESIYTTPFEIFFRRWIQQKKLIVDIYLKPDVLPGKDNYRQTEYWTKTPAEELHAKGYREAVGLHDSIFWWNVQIFVKIHNAVEFPIKEIYPEKKDTAYTLNDAMLSNTDREFKRSMARAQLTATADWQKLGLIAILGVGVIIATKWFGIW